MTTKPSIKSRDGSNTESCGYATFILSTVFYFIYLLWAFLPDYIVEHIDVNYTTYYPPRDLAGYIPAYLVLLVVSALFIYMGLNMLSCPSVDSIDNIWDTQSIPSCSSTSLFATKDVYKDQRGVNDYSVPIICDEDVRLVNLRLRQLHMS